jgi:ABC-type Mn2+/Zn2+ transport system ATPase subunit
MTTAISMVGLTKAYKGVQALTDLTLDVPAGTVYGFLGPNGAGKSTAMKLIAGLARATSGSASVNGVPVSTAGDHRRHLGYLAQDAVDVNRSLGGSAFGDALIEAGFGETTRGAIALTDDTEELTDRPVILQLELRTVAGN